MNSISYLDSVLSRSISHLNQASSSSSNPNSTSTSSPPSKRSSLNRASSDYSLSTSSSTSTSRRSASSSASPSTDAPPIRDPLLRSTSEAPSNQRSSKQNLLKPLTSLSTDAVDSIQVEGESRRSSRRSSTDGNSTTGSKKSKGKGKAKDKARSSNKSSRKSSEDENDLSISNNNSDLSSDLDQAQDLQFKENGNLVGEMNLDLVLNQLDRGENEEEDPTRLGHSRSKASSEPASSNRGFFGRTVSSPIKPLSSTTTSTPSKSSRPPKLIRSGTEYHSSSRRKRSGSGSSSRGHGSSSKTTPSTPRWGSLWGLAGWLDPVGNELDRELEKIDQNIDLQEEKMREERRRKRKEEKRRLRREERRREEEEEGSVNEDILLDQDGNTIEHLESRRPSSSSSQTSRTSSSSASSSRSSRKSKSSKRSSRIFSSSESSLPIERNNLTSSQLLNIGSRNHSTDGLQVSPPLKTPEMLSEKEREDVVEFEVEIEPHEHHHHQLQTTSSSSDSNPSTPMMQYETLSGGESLENTPSSSSISNINRDSMNQASTSSMMTSNYNAKNLKSLKINSKNGRSNVDDDLNPLTPPPPLLPRDLRGDYFGDYSHGIELDFSTPLIERKKSEKGLKGFEGLGLGFASTSSASNFVESPSSVEMRKSSSKSSQISNGSLNESSSYTGTSASNSTTTSNSNSTSNSRVSSPRLENAPGLERDEDAILEGDEKKLKSKSKKKGKGKGRKGKGKSKSKKKEKDVEEEPNLDPQESKEIGKVSEELSNGSIVNTQDEEKTPKPKSIASFSSEDSRSNDSLLENDSISISTAPTSVASSSSMDLKDIPLEKVDSISSRSKNKIGKFKTFWKNFFNGLISILLSPIYGPVYIGRWINRRVNGDSHKEIVKISFENDKSSSKSSSSLTFKDEKIGNGIGERETKSGKEIHSLKPPTPKPEKQNFVDEDDAGEKAKVEEREKREISAELSTLPEKEENKPSDSQPQLRAQFDSKPSSNVALSSVKGDLNPTSANQSLSPRKSKLLPNPHSVDPMLTKEPKARRVGQPGGLLDVSQEIGSALFNSNDEEDLALMKAKELREMKEMELKNRNEKLKNNHQQHQDQSSPSISTFRSESKPNNKDDLVISDTESNLQDPSDSKALIKNNKSKDSSNRNPNNTSTRVIGHGLMNSSIPRGPASTVIHHSPKILVLDLDETLIHSTSRSPTWGVLRSTNTRPHDVNGVDTGSSLLGFGNLSLLSLGMAGTGRPGSVRPHMVEVVIGGRSVIYHVYKRPWVDYFLRKVSGT